MLLLKRFTTFEKVVPVELLDCTESLAVIFNTDTMIQYEREYFIIYTLC